MFFSPNICSNPVNNPKLYPTLCNLESIKSEKKIQKCCFATKMTFLPIRSKPISKRNPRSKAISQRNSRPKAEIAILDQKCHFFRKISAKSLFLETLFFSEKVAFEDIFEKKDIFSSLHMILNLNLNNLHLVLELVYLISALIVEDE